MKKFLAIAVVAAFAAAVAARDATQDKDKPPKKLESPPAAKKAEEPPTTVIVRAQLPRGYRGIGLSDTQKKALYKVRAVYAVKMQKLKEEMEALRLKEIEDMEALLTDAQRSRLKERPGSAEGKK